MKNKKAFTLIELLAVIVVLAVILAISIPAVTGIVNSARKKAFSESARLIVTAAINKGGNDGTLDLASIDVTNVKAILGVKNTNYNSVSLNKDNDSIYLVVSGRGEWSNLKACGTYHDMVVTDLSDASVCPEVVVDTDPGIICDYETESVCHIRSVEDLTAFSVMVNDTKHNYDFTDHTVILDTNLDIENPSSYVSSTTLAFGDINGDGFVSSLIKELTTKNGFQPIGSKTKKFKGTFEGEARTISNIYINRPSLVYTGLFGYNSGTIRGLNATSFDITGGVYTAGIAAYNTGMISSVVFNGSIDSNQNQYMGFISSQNDSIVNGVLVKDSTNKEYFTGSNTIAPNSDWSANETTVGLSESCTSGTCSYTYVLTSYSDYPQNINSNISNQITAYGFLLDTWIGGDNDSDGYYFDYDNNSKIILKSVANDPMIFNLAGNGTENDPYLISDSDDWRQATLKTQNNYYFKLTNNIDFNDKDFYAMGDYNNYFSGSFDGNAYKISNMNFATYQYGGIFSYNNGTIKGLNVEGLNLYGSTYTGGITGYNNGSITSISLQGSITSDGQNTGGIAGYNDTSKIVSSVLVNANVTSQNDYVSGVVGHNLGIIRAIVRGGKLVSPWSNKAGIISCQDNSFYGTYCNSAGIIGYSSTDFVSWAGYTNEYVYDAALDGDINVYDAALDTWIGGDNDSDGYYFDYNSSNNIVIKSVLASPMTFALSGSGTQESPYLIGNSDNWKQATLKTNGNYYFKLTSNIDFSGKNYYAMGSNANYFNGTFDGDDYTLSNISLKGLTNSGMFGYNNGTVKGLNLDGVNFTGLSYNGIITGYNNGTIKGLNLKNVTLLSGRLFLPSTNGGNYAGGIAGYNTGSINSINIEASINTTYEYAGGVAGYSSSTGNITSILSTVSIINRASRHAGIVGVNFGVLNGVILKAGNIDGMSNSDVITGEGTSQNTFVSSSVTANGCWGGGSSGIVYPAASNGDINVYESGLDTWIGGDNDGDGYYFDYNNSGNIVVKSTEKSPMTFSLAGAGTENDPYLIGNSSDWKMASLKAINGYTFKLTNDITFADKTFYILGSYSSPFSGHFLGNGKTISNLNYKGITYGGIFGYNNGTIEDLNVVGLTLTGVAYDGGIVGYNNGTVKGINVTNSIFYTALYSGGIAGFNNGTISDVNAQSTINVAEDGWFAIGDRKNSIPGGTICKAPESLYGLWGSSMCIGGITGYNGVNKTIINALSNLSMPYTGTTGLGGMAGENEGTINGVVDGGSYIGGGSSVGTVAGSNTGTYTVYVTSGLTAEYVWIAGLYGTSFPSENVNSLFIYDEYGLDTRIGGDNDSSGYYFDYNSNQSDIIVKSFARDPIVTAPVTYPDVEEPAGTDTNESACSITSNCTATGTKSMRCGYTYLYNNTPISGYQSGYTFSMTKGSSCATAVANNTDGGLIISVGKKSTATGTCSVVLKVIATGGTYNCASTKYSSFTFN